MARVFNRYSLSSMLKHVPIQELNGCNVYYDLFYDNMVTIFTIDSKIPVKLIYNSYNINACQYNYKFNFLETLQLKYAGGIDFIAHIDGLSRVHHYYKNENCYVCENDNNKIIEEDDKYFYLTDKDGNKKTFIKTKSRTCYLVEQIRKNKKIEIELSNSYRITKIKYNDYEIEITYSKGKLIEIRNNTLNTILFYNKDKTFNLVNADGITSFTLNSNRLIRRIYSQNYEYKYDYDSRLPYKLQKVTKINQEGIVESIYLIKHYQENPKIPISDKIFRISEYDSNMKEITKDKQKI